MRRRGRALRRPGIAVGQNAGEGLGHAHLDQRLLVVGLGHVDIDHVLARDGENVLRQIGEGEGRIPGQLIGRALMAFGLGFASANVIHDEVASATRALSSAMTNPASGGSGASGGSSGGGGGGGGGGSW